MMNDETARALAWGLGKNYQSVSARYARALALHIVDLEARINEASSLLRPLKDDDALHGHTATEVLRILKGTTSSQTEEVKDG